MRCLRRFSFEMWGWAGADDLYRKDMKMAQEGILFHLGSGNSIEFPLLCLYNKMKESYL